MIGQRENDRILFESTEFIYKITTKLPTIEFSDYLPSHQSGIWSILPLHLPLMLKGKGTAPGQGTWPGVSQIQGFSHM